MMPNMMPTMMMPNMMMPGMNMGMMPMMMPGDMTLEMRERMSGNLCRCGAYNGIIDAISASLEVQR